MKPKSLTLREIHILYLLLRDCLPEKEEAYLIDEIEKMVDRMKDGSTLVRAVEIMYRKKISQDNPVKLLLWFIQGLKANNFFNYAIFINELKRGRRAS